MQLPEIVVYQDVYKKQLALKYRQSCTEYIYWPHIQSNLTARRIVCKLLLDVFSATLVIHARAALLQRASCSLLVRYTVLYTADFYRIRQIHLVTDRISVGGNALTFVRPSLCQSVCFHSIFGTDGPLILKFCMWVGHDHSSQGIEGQGQVKVIGQGQGHGSG